MKIGYIGLGKMGAGMVSRLLEKGYEMVAFDPNAKAVKKISSMLTASIANLILTPFESKKPL